MAETGNQSASLHILVVDDNFPAAQTTGWMVETMGHAYDLANGADTALTAAQLKAPDVILMDIGLPGVNGFDLCTEMKAMPALSETVFIAHTGYGEQRHRDRAAQVGCSHFLLKPFEPAKLEAILTDIARTKRDPSLEHRI